MKVKLYLGLCPERIDVLFDKKKIDKTRYLRVFEKTVDIPEEIIAQAKSKPTPVYTTCYGKRDKWPSAKKAIEYFRTAADCSDGCERERYLNIMMKLTDGETDVDDQR